MPMVSFQPPITSRSFSIVTSTDKPLQRDVKLLFTITLDGLAQSAKADTTFAWEIVSFSANSNDEKTFTWHPGCNMSLRFKDTFDKARVSDRVQPGNYVELDGDRTWDINTFYNGNADQIVAINRSNATEEFVLGAVPEASSNSEPFQPYILLRQLKKKEGLATAIPYCLQAYVVTKCTRHHLITEKLSEGLLRQGGQEVPLRLDQLAERTRWHLYSEGEKIIMLDKYDDVAQPKSPDPAEQRKRLSSVTLEKGIDDRSPSSDQGQRPSYLHRTSSASLREKISKFGSKTQDNAATLRKPSPPPQWQKPRTPVSPAPAKPSPLNYATAVKANETKKPKETQDKALAPPGSSASSRMGSPRSTSPANRLPSRGRSPPSPSRPLAGSLSTQKTSRENQTAIQLSNSPAVAQNVNAPGSPPRHVTQAAPASTVPSDAKIMIEMPPKDTKSVHTQNVSPGARVPDFPPLSYTPPAPQGRDAGNQGATPSITLGYPPPKRISPTLDPMSRPPTEDTPDTRLAILSPFASSEDPFDSPMTIPDSTEELFESLVSTSFPPSSKPHVETSADNTSSLRELTIAKVETAAKSSIGISSFGNVKTLSRPFVVSEPIGIPSTSTADSRGAPLTQTQSLLMTEHSEADSQADISKQSKFASQPSARTGSADLYISDPVMPLKEQGSIAAKTPESGAGLAVKPPTLDSHETPTIAKRLEAAPVDHQSPGLITDKPNDVAQMSPALFPDNQKIALQGNNEPPTRQHTPPDNALHAEFGTLSKAFTGASPLNEATEVSQTSILNTKSEAGRHGKRLNASSVLEDRPGSLRSPAAAVSLSGPAKVNRPDISNGSSMSSGRALADPDPHNLSSDGEHSSQSDTYGDESRDELGENISDDKEGLRIEGDPSGTLTLSATARKRDVEVERDSEERMVTTIRGHTFNGEQGNIDRSGAHHEKQFSRTSLVPKPPPSDPSSTPKQVGPLTSMPTMQNRNANDQKLPTGKDPQSKPSMTDSPLKNEALGKLYGRSMAETRDPVSQPNARSLEGGRQVLQSQGNLLAAESPLMSNDSNLSKPMDTTRHQERRLAVNTSPDNKHARVSIDETPEKNITGIHGSSTLEMVDLVPLRDTLREVADLISGQIPYEDLSWGRAVLAQFGTQVRPLLVQFMEDSPKWKGFVVAAPS